jgi:nitrate/nitrite-specific signal transduction histidine kinase
LRPPFVGLSDTEIVRGPAFRRIGVAAERLRKGRRKVASSRSHPAKDAAARLATDAAFGLDGDHQFMDEAPVVDLAEPIEVATYFVASEALANAAKHSDASRIDVSLEQRDGNLVLSGRDDGVGGADAALGSGIVGLTDRVEALGGSISVHSREGNGTQIRVELPVELELPQPAG